MFVCPHMFIHPHIFVHPQRCTHPHMPLYSSVHLCVFGGFACCGGCNGCPFVLGHPPLHHPCLGVPPLHLPLPTLSHWFPVHQYVSGISVCYVGISLLLKGLGVFPHQLGALGASAPEMSICSLLCIFCSALCLTFRLQL